MNLSTYEPMNESNQKSNTKSINTGDILKKRESDDTTLRTTKMKKNKG